MGIKKGREWAETVGNGVALYSKRGPQTDCSS